MRPDPQPRFLAVDEGPFRFEDPTVPVVGVMTRGARNVEAVVVDEVTVDGWDATDRLIGMTRRLPGAGPDRILLDGISLGGLNLVDLDLAAGTLDRVVLGITRRGPDRDAMASAIERAPDPGRRRSLLPGEPPQKVTCGGTRLHVQVATPDGIPIPDHEVARLLAPGCEEGGLPEPLRLAHHIATAIVRGVSGTRP